MWSRLTSISFRSMTTTSFVGSMKRVVPLVRGTKPSRSLMKSLRANWRGEGELANGGKERAVDLDQKLTWRAGRWLEARRQATKSRRTISRMTAPKRSHDIADDRVSGNCEMEVEEVREQVCAN